MKNEIILYRPDELAEHIEVRLEDETVWLNRNQIAILFGRDVKTIGKHINNVFNEGELEKEVVIANFATSIPHSAIKGKTQTTFTEHGLLHMQIKKILKISIPTKRRPWMEGIFSQISNLSLPFKYYYA